jgi:hypothetical protein
VVYSEKKTHAPRIDQDTGLHVGQLLAGLMPEVSGLL